MGKGKPSGNKTGVRLKEKILVTGGAGFIGSHLVDLLVEKGHEVRVFDNLDKQAHVDGKKPSHLNKKAEFVQGDVRDKNKLKQALEGIDAVYHFAAAVGVGQSMYAINYYVESNNVGTSNLLELLVNEEHDVKKIVVAASMSSYGEGLYKCDNCGFVEPPLRTEAQMEKKKWGVYCNCGQELLAVPTPETKSQKSNSIYALTKKDQEEMVLMIGKTYGIKSVAMRFFNVFGIRQSLSNPYTGVTAIFLSRLKNSNPPLVYEDGLQSRDFVSVYDVVQANYLALKSSNADFESFNVGTGKPIAIRDVAIKTANALGVSIMPQITQTYRKGDVRHCFADTKKISSKLEWKPRYSFEDGLREIIEWSKGVKAVDKFDSALSELKQRKLA